METRRDSAEVRINAAWYYFVEEFILPSCAGALGDWDFSEKEVITEITSGEGPALEKRLFLEESRKRILESREDLRKEGKYKEGPKIIMNLGPSDEEIESMPKITIGMYSPYKSDNVYMRITHKMNSRPKNIEEATAELDLVSDLKDWARENSIDRDLIEGETQTLALMNPENYRDHIPYIQGNIDAGTQK